MPTRIAHRLQPHTAATLRDAVASYAERRANADGLTLTDVEGLRMMRVHAPSGPMRSLYTPLVCLVLQGAKQMTIGRDTRVYREGQAVVVGVDLPVIGQVIEASAASPYLAVAIDLDMEILQSLAIEMGIDEERSLAKEFVFAGELDATLLDCALRMMRLLEDPGAERILRTSLLRELHYWPLRSPHGPALRNLALPTSNARRIGIAIEHIRHHFNEPIDVERVAALATLSPSAFRRHFKSLTTLSPRQFQKQLRLIEARRLLLSKGITATQAAAVVGYESASQFSREYARMFGAPPRQHQRIGTARPVARIEVAAGKT